MSPFSGIDMEDPLDVRLSIPREPVFENTTPEEVAPLRYTELVAVMDPDAVPVSTTVGVLKSIVGDCIPP